MYAIRSLAPVHKQGVSLVSCLVCYCPTGQILYSRKKLFHLSYDKLLGNCTQFGKMPKREAVTQMLGFCTQRVLIFYALFSMFYQTLY
jgi:hypothetical protein